MHAKVRQGAILEIFGLLHNENELLLVSIIEFSP